MNYTSCFVGIPLPDKLQSEFRTLIASLGELDLGIKLVHPATAHITLYYLAEQSQTNLAEIAARIGQQKHLLESTTISIHGLGVFSRALYLDVNESLSLEAANRAFRTLLHAYYAAEHNLPFRAHMTVARVPSEEARKAFDERRTEVEMLCDSIHWTFPVRELVLYGVKSSATQLVHQRLHRITIER